MVCLLEGLGKPDYTLDDEIADAMRRQIKWGGQRIDVCPSELANKDLND